MENDEDIATFIVDNHVDLGITFKSTGTGDPPSGTTYDMHVKFLFWVCSSWTSKMQYEREMGTRFCHSGNTCCCSSRQLIGRTMQLKHSLFCRNTNICSHLTSLNS